MASFLQWAISLSIIHLSFVLSSNAEPIVSTSCGQIKGKVISTSRGQCDAYLGVPFAQPPIGDLRWRKPTDPKCWQGVKDATIPGPKCIQINSTGANSTGESEDCLILNIFVPKDASSQKLPVMIFIHGGAFIFGSAIDYGLEGPCENLASRGVILVLLQYRLFIYGFLSTGDKAALGNYGLWDQVQALKWVQNNIASFGGDPTKVTIFGESAGAASVSYLTYTPVAKDLFHQSLAESGSAFSTWAPMTDASVATAKRVAKVANCSDSNSEAYLNCLRKLSTMELQQVYNSIPNILTDNFYEVWSIRVDGELFTSSELTEPTTMKPTVVGLNTMETPVPDPTYIPFAHDLFDYALSQTIPGNKSAFIDMLKQAAQYVYIDSKGSQTDDKFVYEQSCKLEADCGFHAAVAHEAILKMTAGSPVWVYNFDYWSDNIFPADYQFQKGAPHAHELCYLFLMIVDEDVLRVGCPNKYDGDYRLIANYLGEMWTNFAKNGDPSPSNMVWPKFYSLTNASAMTIRTKLSIETQYYLEATNFWYYLKPNMELDYANAIKNQTQPKCNSSDKLRTSLLLLISVTCFLSGLLIN